MTSGRCFLVLEDGSDFPGLSFGFPPPAADDLVLWKSTKNWNRAGEVVFNTGMTGYPEILTDPSYTGQIIVMTYPHIGNYGVDESWSETGTGVSRNSNTVKAAGLVVRSLYSGMLPHGRKSLDLFLTEQSVTGITEIDTRALTLKLRKCGALGGVIVSGERGVVTLSRKERETCIDFLCAFPPMVGRNLVEQVGLKAIEEIQIEDHEFKLAVIDCGIKANIVRELGKKRCALVIVPSVTKAEEILALEPDGVLISNGPGDPAVLTGLIGEIRILIEKVPVFGICLGHQLISIALGGRTFKMKFGHHGVNNPVRDEITKKVYVTSQNHGFTVDPESLPEGTAPWFINANDNTIEGLVHKTLPVRSVQFHPEAAPGPRDTTWVFSSFIDAIRNSKKAGRS